jgi:hypothetical protein
MTPVEPPRLRVHGSHVVQMPVFLPQFVGEKKRDDEERKDEKNAQYQVLDHGGLRLHEHRIHFRAAHVPALPATAH